MSYRLEMCRIHAARDMAQMIELESLLDRSNENEIRMAMSVATHPVDTPNEP